MIKLFFKSTPYVFNVFTHAVFELCSGNRWGLSDLHAFLRVVKEVFEQPDACLPRRKSIVARPKQASDWRATLPEGVGPASGPGAQDNWNAAW